MPARFYTTIKERGIDVCTVVETDQWDIRFLGAEARELKLEPIIMWFHNEDKDGRDAVRIHEMAVNTIKTGTRLKTVYNNIREIVRQLRKIREDAASENPIVLEKKKNEILND